MDTGTWVLIGVGVAAVLGAVFYFRGRKGGGGYSGGTGHSGGGGGSTGGARGPGRPRVE